MFAGANSFNRDISLLGYELNGTDFSYMFKWAFVFDKDIGDWDVSNGTDFSYMFLGAE